jgi:uncharacterized protein involved in type VI secretion and phage assembly
MPVIIHEFEVEPERPDEAHASQDADPVSQPPAGDFHRRVAPQPAAPRYGVFPAVVIDNQDPHMQGRVEVSLPWAQDAVEKPYRAWARLATLSAGDQRGSWFIPEVDDEVLVVFEAGDPARPYVIGSLWNGQDTPPVSMDAEGQNRVKMLRTRSGLQISLDDSPDSERLELSTPGGQKLILKDSPGSVEITSGDSRIVIKGSRIEVETSGVLVMDASTVVVNASMLTVNAPMAKFSGVLQTDTLLANSVVASSYTPGAGNVW